MKRRQLQVGPIDGSILKIVSLGGHGPGRDMLVVSTTCSCPDHFDPKIEIPVIIETARALGTGKVVLIGGCSDGKGYWVSRIKNQIEENSLSFIWLDYLGFSDPAIHLGTVSGTEFVNYYLALVGESRFGVNYESWGDVLRTEAALPHLVEMAKLFRDIRKKIDQESMQLIVYPIIRKVTTFRMVNSPALATLLKVSSEAAAEANLVLGFTPDRSRCKIFSKSRDFEFEVDGDPNQDTLLDSHFYYGFTDDCPLVVTDQTGMPFRISTEPGVWYAEPHPVLDSRNVDTAWVPLWKRLARYGNLRCQGDGQEFSGMERCVHCGTLSDPTNACIELMKNAQQEILTELVCASAQ